MENEMITDQIAVSIDGEDITLDSKRLFYSNTVEDVELSANKYIKPTMNAHHTSGVKTCEEFESCFELLNS